MMEEVLSFLLQLAYQYADSIAFLTLSAIGLIIIFGMMGVINMAHGEFMMIGAYVTSYTYFRGVPFPVAILLAAVAVGLIGVVLERLIVRRFYGQLLMSLVATWGLSLVLSQGFLVAFGPSTRTVPTSLGSFSYAERSYSWYTVVRFTVAVGLLALLWVVLAHTKWGVRARATIENAEMASALGINTARTYALTFALGAAMAGVAGGLFAALSEITPSFGGNYTPLAFITVVVGGGANVITGLLTSVLSLGGVRTLVTNQFSVLLGYVAMLVAALVIIRFMPAGISDYLERRKLRALRP